MQHTIVVLALAAVAMANPVAQVTANISPASPPPSGCSPNYSGLFSVTTVNASTANGAKAKRQNGMSTLMISLTNGKLIDNLGDTGYIAANHQFQFDKPPQTGAIYTDGWSICSNHSLALGGSAVFYQCLSGNFYNIYDQSQGAQCSAIYINMIPQSSSGAVTAGSASAVSTISDGQPQATKGAVSTISDHQPQATTPAGGAGGAAVSTISDHQPQAAGTGSLKPISTISDHQPQAAGTGSLKPISTISDHQPQAGTAATGVVAISTISDHQPQATTALASAPAFGSASRTSGVVQFTGAASMPGRASELMALAVGAVAVAMI